MHDEWTLAERSLWIFRYLSQGDGGKTQKPGNLTAVYKRQFSIPRKAFVDTEIGTTGR